VLAAIFALAGNYSFVQGNLIWLVTLPVILFAPEILPASVRRNFAIAWAVIGVAAVARYFVGLEQNAAAPDYAYGHIAVPPTLSTLQQLRDDPVSTLSSRMGRFILGMFGNAISRQGIRGTPCHARFQPGLLAMKPISESRRNHERKVQDDLRGQLFALV
jgi:hypothetical protein